MTPRTAEKAMMEGLRAVALDEQQNRFMLAAFIVLDVTIKPSYRNRIKGFKPPLNNDNFLASPRPGFSRHIVFFSRKFSTK